MKGSNSSSIETSPTLTTSDAEENGESHTFYHSIQIEHKKDGVGMDQRTADIATGEEKAATFKFSILPGRGKCVLVLCTFANFFAGCAFSLLVPFFPLTADTKGMSQVLIGFVFGVFEMIIFLFSPLIGNYLTKIGPKFVYLCGIFVAGICVILFGTLDKCPSGLPFIVISILVRSAKALGVAAFVTACFAIVSSEFPDYIGIVFGILETGSGVGFMIGPTIGGALYELGGYGLPFYTMGVLILLNGVVLFTFLPKPQSVENKRKNSMFGLLRSPMLVVPMGTVFLGGFSVAAFDSTFAKHIEPLVESTSSIGLYFVIGPVLFAAMSPLWGFLVDTKNIRVPLIILGHFTYGLGFMISGPGFFLPFLSNHLWTLLLGLTLFGMSLGCMCIPTMACMVRGAVDIGYKNNIDTLALVSGIFTSAKSLGGFLGPLAGGAIVQLYGFRVGYSVVGFSHFVWMVVPSIFLCYLQRKKKNPGCETVTDNEDDKHERASQSIEME